MRRTIALAVIVLVGALSVLPACNGQTASPAQPKAAGTAAPAVEKAATAKSAKTGAAAAKLRLSYTSLNAFYWPYWVAEDKGFYREDGVEVENYMMRSNPECVQAIVSGSVEIAGGCATDTLILATEQGAKLKFVSGLMVTAPYDLMAKATIKSLADLKGTSIAVGALKTGSTIQMQEILKQSGLKSGEYDLIVAAGATDRYSALQSGSVAATILSPPMNFSSEAEGFKVLASFPKYYPDYDFISIAVNSDYADKNADSIVRFLKGTVKAEQWLYKKENKAEAIAILMKETKVSRDLATKSYKYYIEDLKAITKDGSISDKAFAKTIEVMGQQGSLQLPLPAQQKYVNLSFLGQAQRELEKR